MRIYVKNISGEKVLDIEGTNQIETVYEKSFEVGDVIVFETEHPYVTISCDPHVMETNAYIPRGRFEFAIPFGEKATAYHPMAFKGDRHILSIKVTENAILKSRRNIGQNALDKRDIATCFPHSDANVMTRDEAVFESRNAIDGYCDNKGHGEFPYQSWGGGLRDDLEFELYFGRNVEFDEICLVLRADYVGDHDINWASCVAVFSDGSELPINMIKTTEKQHYRFESKKVSWIKLNRLKREISSAFSALSQIEVYGKDI